jgi:Flp pilus assembly CpaF family ATPase
MLNQGVVGMVTGDQKEVEKEIEEKVERYLNEFIRQKINEKYGKLEKILTDSAVEEIEVCVGDFGIYLESDVVGRELFFEFTPSEAYWKTARALVKEYPAHVKTIDEILDRELGYLHSNFFDHLEEILKEHGFGEIELGGNDCFIFRKG